MKIHLLQPAVFSILFFVTVFPKQLSAAESENDTKVEITGTGGFQFGGSTDFDNGTASLDSGPTVGGMLGYRVSENAAALLGYHYQFSKLDVHLDNALPYSFDVGVGYLQIGGEIEFPANRLVRPFLGMTLGAVHITPEPKSAHTEWFFAGALFGGLKLGITRFFGIRAQFKLLVTFLADDSDMFCLSNGVCAVRLDTDAMAQGEVSGGVYLAF